MGEIEIKLMVFHNFVVNRGDAIVVKKCGHYLSIVETHR